jgi:hypothetical protein
MSTELATTTEITTIEPKRWGRDHWSLLGYIATCFDGEIDRRKLRCNENRHPMLAHCHSAWKDEWSTRLKSTPEGEHIKAIGHDDWDCLDDLEAAGMVNVFSLVNGFVRLTEYGSRVAFRLRQHKEKGGNFGDFVFRFKGPKK